MHHGRREIHRPARIYPAPVDRADLILPSPPKPPDPPDGVIQTLLPALGSLGMFGFALVSGDPRFLVFAGVMGCAMLLASLVARSARRRIAARRHARRSARYRAMLQAHRTILVEAGSLQRRTSHFSYPSPVELWSVVVDGRRIWERRAEHGDFATIRIGTGPAPRALCPRPEADTDPLADADEELIGLARRLVEDFGMLEDEPVTLDLADAGCVAIVGGFDRARETARAILSQLVVLRAPDDVRLVVAHTNETADWFWATQVPHATADGGHLVTEDADDLATILAQFGRPRLQHLETSEGLSGSRRPPPVFPRVVVVLDGYRPDDCVGRMELLDDLMVAAPRIGFTFLCIVEEPELVPSAATLTISVDSGRLLARSASPDAPTICAVPDVAPPALLAQLSTVLKPIHLRARTGRATTFESSGVCELLGLTDPQTSCAAELWQPRSIDDQLRTPIGVAEDGTPVLLDIKESSTGGMGPHGMLIGATGSGKSELLRTLVLGLAARHDPEQVAFVLVDFKGGATFATLDRLPHSAGLITNLERDPSLVDRMLEALYGELELRQGILRDAGGFDRADEYRAHRTAHPEAGIPPLPALLLVVDEFGELLAARPEFGDLFATIGRVGRSLGVHLLLSSQRLEDGKARKLESHLRYRLCLRTFTPEESTAVIGSRAAAELPPIPGVGYVKVDGATRAFKAGLASRPLRGTDRTEMEHLVAVLGDESTAHRRTRPVWLEPLPTARALTDVEAETAPVSPGDAGWLRIPVGWEDDPRRQRVTAMVLDFTGARGHLAVVGGPRSGKSTTLQTIVSSMALSHSPRDVQVYAIDFGGGALHLLEDLPHIGAVLSRNQRAEISNLVRRLRTLIEERADTFRRHRINDMVAYHELRHRGAVDDELGEVFLVIDNWGGFIQDQATDIGDAVGRLVGSGLHHGVHLLVATPRWQDIKLSMRDHIGGRFELRLADPIDSEIDRRAAASVPEVPGRGVDLEARQVQIALPRIDGAAESSSVATGVDTLVQSVCRRWVDHSPAAPVRVLPATVVCSELPPADQIVLGIEEHRLGPWTVDLFGAEPHVLVFGDAESGKTNLLALLIGQLCRRHTPDELRVAVVDYRRRVPTVVPGSHRLGVATGPDSAAALASRISADLAARMLPDDVASLRHSGPAYVMIVDDYDLVAGPTGNPLSPLLDRVAHGRDLGFHLVLARRVGGTARAAFEPLFQRVRELGSPGLVLAGDPREGAILGGVKAAPRPPGRGTWVDRGRVTEVQVGLLEPVGWRAETIRAAEDTA